MLNFNQSISLLLRKTKNLIIKGYTWPFMEYTDNNLLNRGKNNQGYTHPYHELDFIHDIPNAIGNAAGRFLGVIIIIPLYYVIFTLLIPAIILLFVIPGTIIDTFSRHPLTTEKIDQVNTNYENLSEEDKLQLLNDLTHLRSYSPSSETSTYLIKYLDKVNNGYKMEIESQTSAKEGELTKNHQPLTKLGQAEFNVFANKIKCANEDKAIHDMDILIRNYMADDRNSGKKLQHVIANSIFALSKKAAETKNSLQHQRLTPEEIEQFNKGYALLSQKDKLDLLTKICHFDIHSIPHSRLDDKLLMQVNTTRIRFCKIIASKKKDKVAELSKNRQDINRALVEKQCQSLQGKFTYQPSSELTEEDKKDLDVYMKQILDQEYQAVIQEDEPFIIKYVANEKATIVARFIVNEVLSLAKKYDVPVDESKVTLVP